MRWEVVIWAALAVMLFAAEALAPGAFMLWMGFAAAAVFLVVWAFEGMTVLLQVILFVVLSFVSIQVYRTWFRKRGRESEQPLLNRLVDQALASSTEARMALARIREARALREAAESLGLDVIHPPLAISFSATPSKTGVEA